MRLPFDLNKKPNLEDEARVKFLYTSPELKQNIEISLDGDETTVETLLDAFQRFLGALGVPLPENTALGLFEISQEEDEEDDDDEDFYKKEGNN